MGSAACRDSALSAAFYQSPCTIRRTAVCGQLEIRNDPIKEYRFSTTEYFNKK